MCGLLTETIMHVFCDCVELRGFFVQLKNLLKCKLRLFWNCNDEWDAFLLFGVWRESQVQNKHLCKFLLSQARSAI